jgi:nucleoside-diphosphate-sugar epimerase
VIIDMISYSLADGDSLINVAKGKCKQLIFCSTVDVYQKPAGTYPYTEAEPRRSLSDYGRIKTANEDAVAKASKEFGFEYTVIRPAATYGEGGVIIHSLGWRTTFLDRMRKGLPVIVLGDGQAIWTMCHVDDCAKAFVGACLNPKSYGQSYHATGEEWMTWDQFHRTVAEALGVDCPELVHIPTDVLTEWLGEKAAIATYNFQYSNFYDNSKAKADLGFSYEVSFLEGAKRTIASIESRGGFEDCSKEPEYDQLIARWKRAIKTT